MNSDDSSDSAVEPDADSTDTSAPRERSGRPLVAGAIGLLAGIAGGIAGTTIAPGSVYVTVLLVAIVVVLVTVGSLRLLAR